MASRIERLQICAFRGATTELVIEFDPGKPVTMIFGENGTGKSTIVDAIGFVCNGDLGSLNHKKLGAGYRKESYIRTLGRGYTDVRVEMQYGGRMFTAGHSDRGATLDAATDRPQAYILRRAELLQFIEGDAAARYKQVAKFITIPGIEIAENALRESVKTAKAELEEATRAKVQAEEALDIFWKAEGEPRQTAISWAREEAAKDEAGLRAEKEARDALLAVWDTLRNAITSYDTAISQYRATEEALEVAQNVLREAEQKSDGGRAALLEVLKDASAYLAQGPSEGTCPVCERPGIASAHLVARLNQRISAFNELDNAVKKVSSATRELQGKQSNLDSSKEALVDAAGQVTRTFSSTNCQEVIRANIAWTKYSVLQEEHSDSNAADCIQQAQNLVSELTPLMTDVETRRASDQKRLHQLNAIKQHVTTIDEKTIILEESAEQSQRLERALQVVETKRKAFIENILDEISTDVDAIYKKIHPREGIGNLHMRLAANRQGSLNYGADFGGQSDIQPQAYYSDSHLDTLGVCVFLALTKRYADDSRIVVLDDVFTSVDQHHLGRIVDALHDEADHFNQIILTTHYRPWRDRYRNARGPGGKVLLLELRPWRVETGIVHDKTHLSAEELRQALASSPFDRQSVASKAGVLLENILDFLALKYRCRVPRLPDPVYTLSDLLGSMNRQLKRALCIDVLGDTGGVSASDKLETTLQELEAGVFVRNQVGAHYNETGTSLSDAEVREFGELTLTFAALLICRNCGSMPT